MCSLSCLHKEPDAGMAPKSTCLPKTYTKHTDRIGEQLKVPKLNEIKPMGKTNHLVTPILGSLGIRLSYRKKTLRSQMLFLKGLHCFSFLTLFIGLTYHIAKFSEELRNFISRGLSSLGNSLHKNSYPTSQLKIMVNEL